MPSEDAGSGSSAPCTARGGRNHRFTSISPAVSKEDSDEMKSIDLGSYDYTSDPVKMDRWDPD